MATLSPPHCHNYRCLRLLLICWQIGTSRKTWSPEFPVGATLCEIKKPLNLYFTTCLLDTKRIQRDKIRRRNGTIQYNTVLTAAVQWLQWNIHSWSWFSPIQIWPSCCFYVPSAALRSKRKSSKRVKFESDPSWFRNSLWHRRILEGVAKLINLYIIVWNVKHVSV